MSWGTSVLSATLSASEESAAENLNFVAAWAIDLIEWLGLPGVAIAIALENLFPPLPSELILPVAGFAASQGTLGLFAVILWATLGSVVGALALYVIGVWLGRDRVHRLLVKVPLVSVEDVNRTEAWFNKYGKRTVFFGRMVPVFRSLISIPAGVTRMPLWYFIPLTAAGSLIWNTIFVVAGYVLGENWSAVEQYAGIIQDIVIIAVILAIAIFIVRRVLVIMRRKRGEINDLGEDISPPTS
jgi:membrane protein DedA with SNARE-associated domain